MRERLSSRKAELEDMLTELNAKLDEGEEQVEKLTEEKKKLQVLLYCIHGSYETLKYFNTLISIHSGNCPRFRRAA